MQSSGHSIDKYPYSVLFADDEEKIRQSMERLLALKYETIYLAKDGAEALEIYKEKSPDIVITDIMMPNMTGLELTKEIREISRETPVIIATAHNETDFFIEAIEYGVVRFLLKPIELPKLFNCIVDLCAALDTKRALKNQQKLLEEYKKAVDASNIISKTDVDGIVTYVNDEFCRISGYSREELIGNNQNIVRHPNMPKETFEQLWHTILAKRIWKGVVENKAKNGDGYWVDATIVPIMDEKDEIVEFIGIRKDITDLILQEKELERLRAKEMRESVDKAIKLNLKNIITINPLPAIIIDEKDLIVDANQHFTSLFDLFRDSDKLDLLERGEATISDFFLKDGALKDFEITMIDWKDVAKKMDDEQETVFLTGSFGTKEFKMSLHPIKDELLYILYLLPDQ